MIETSYGPVDEIKFWSNVKFSSRDQCWEWLGGRDSDGYAMFYLGVVDGKEKTSRVNRLVYELFYGIKIDPRLLACHRCDNPGCVNPHHLFLGTNSDNLMDASRKGRIASGERNGRYTHPERTARGDRHGFRLHPERIARGERCHKTKLKRNDVLEIRQSPENTINLAQKYGVHRHTIQLIQKRLSWRWL